MFFYIVLTPISTTSGIWSTGNTRKYQQVDVYIYQCDNSPTFFKISLNLILNSCWKFYVLHYSPLFVLLTSNIPAIKAGVFLSIWEENNVDPHGQDLQCFQRSTKQKVSTYLSRKKSKRSFEEVWPYFMFWYKTVKPLFLPPWNFIGLDKQKFSV